ncbi:hypothetical protein [Streptomyces sp. XD-27]|uniref:hypothetical protein n=1 Tax=Streptomyces sp. XD-27 TaxID=3062779 RepID=UPI0026F43B40|nr:hypothetical protein [Streptomyces sp. XD-27]WKX69540.1 hypothetical protein Q3Y56_06100 [Streptomyces sp. XD-27]
MSPEELLKVVRLRWDDIRAALDEEQRALLMARLGALAEAPQQDARAVRRAVRGVEHVLLALPPGHPVAAALDGTRLAGPATAGPRVVELARELHARLTTADRPGGPVDADDPGGIIAAARKRLLAQPSLSAQEVRNRCDSTDGLIRLDDPEAGARYPAFQFTGDSGGPMPVVRRVNRLLGAENDPWGAADWWLSGNQWLGGRPASLLGHLPEELLTGAASAMLEGD